MTKDATKDASWGKRITQLMDAANVSSDELARRMRTARSTVYHWRNGFRIPSRDLQPKLAKALGVTVAELNGWAA